jgi:hypothetical protein
MQLSMHPCNLYYINPARQQKTLEAVATRCAYMQLSMHPCDL